MSSPFAHEHLRPAVTIGPVYVTVCEEDLSLPPPPPPLPGAADDLLREILVHLHPLHALVPPTRCSLHGCIGRFRVHRCLLGSAFFCLHFRQARLLPHARHTRPCPQLSARPSAAAWPSSTWAGNRLSCRTPPPASQCICWLK